MTEVDLGVELDMSGSELMIVISRYKIEQKIPSQLRPTQLVASESLHWNEIGETIFDDQSDGDVLDARTTERVEDGFMHQSGESDTQMMPQTSNIFEQIAEVQSKLASMNVQV